MGLNHSPSVVTNGLVFYYDMTNANKSFKGRPITNQYAKPAAGAGTEVAVSFAVQGNGTFYRIYTGTYGGYDLRASDIVYKFYLPGTGGCWYHGNDVTITSGQTATFSFDYYVDPSVTSYPSTNYLANFEGVIGGSIGDPTPSIIGVWKRLSFTGTASSTGTCRMLLYPGACGGYLGTGGFVLFKNVQVEFDAPGNNPTPFVDGTRYTNNNLETVSTPTWNQSASSASGGTLTFTSGSYDTKGTWDLYKTYSGLSTATNYTWSASVKKGTATNLIVTMNNTQDWNTGPANTFSEFSSTEWKRVSITGTTTSGSFNIHLASSYNTGFRDTIQTGGTILIQDVRLQLTSSQTAIQDLVDQNTIAATSLTYASDGTFSFNYDTPNYITVPLASALNKTEGTMNFWVYPTRYSGGNGYFVNREDATANAVDWFWIGPYSDTFYFRLGNGSDCCSNDLSFGSVSTVIPINTWTNMCFTWKSNGTSAIYKNGNLVTSRSLGNVPNTNPASNGRIGLGHGNGPSYFDGKMPIVQIYNRQFTAGEVLQNFNALRGRYGI